MADLTRQQLCGELRISESTVRRLELAGMPCTLIGRAKRYDLAECKRWLRECRSGRTSADAATSASWSMAAGFIASCRRAHLRVVPSKSKPQSGQASGNAA